MFYLSQRIVVLCVVLLLGTFTNAFSGPNANAVVAVDVVDADDSNNKINDDKPWGDAIAGDDVTLEIFIIGLTEPIVGAQIVFDTDSLTIKSAEPPNGFFALGIEKNKNTVAFGAVPSGKLTNNYFGTIVLTPTADVTASTPFTVGVQIKNLASFGRLSDTDDITTQNNSRVSFNPSTPPTSNPPTPPVGSNLFMHAACDSLMTLVQNRLLNLQDSLHQAQRGDLNLDGIINLDDFLIFSENFMRR